MTGNVRLRALLVGLFFGLLLCVATPYSNAVLGNAPLGGGHFPLAPFFIAAWMFVGIAIWSRITGKDPVLSGTEVLITWALMTLFAGISYAGLAETFLVNITAPELFAKDGYRWTEALRPLLPESWFPQSKAAIATAYNGLKGGGDMGFLQILGSIQWTAWLPALAVWSVFILTSYFVMVCLMRLFGRQWVINERVDFPLLRAPQVMGEALDSGVTGSFWTNRYLIMGLTFTLMLHMFNGLHYYFPSVPQLPTLVLAGTYFPKFGLFSGFHKLKLYIIPAFIGFAFLTTRQISFSLWVFHLLAGLLFGVLYVLGLQLPEAALGVTFGPDLVRAEGAQTIGSYAVFFIFLVWLARHHLKNIFYCIIRPSCKGTGLLDDADTPGSKMPQEWAPEMWPLIGLFIGVLVLAFWCWWFGLPPLAAILLPGAFLIVMLVTSRAVCQGGLPYFTLTAAPMDGITGLFGSSIFGSAGIAAAAVMQKVMFLDMRESVMPTLFHTSKIAERVRNRRIVLIAIGLSLVLALAAAFAVMLYLSYKYGMRELKLEWATQTVIANYDSIQRLVDVPSGPNQFMAIYAGVGALVMLTLIFCYYKFPWWPLHPLGYLVAYGAGMKILWFSFFIGWLCNHLCLHYGGTALFKKLRFLFIGFILGDFLTGGVFATIGLFTNTASYSVFPF